MVRVLAQEARGMGLRALTYRGPTEDLNCDFLAQRSKYHTKKVRHYLNPSLLFFFLKLHSPAKRGRYTEKKKEHKLKGAWLLPWKGVMGPEF